MTTTATETAPKAATSGKKGATTERPVMAAKKEFKLPEFKAVDDVPVAVRVNTQARLPIGLDEMFEAAKKTKKAQMRFIPVELWESRGIADDKNTAALNKDRLRRALYSWQGKDAEKLKYTLAFSDQSDAKGNHTGTNMYLTVKPTK